MARPRRGGIRLTEPRRRAPAAPEESGYTEDAVLLPPEGPPIVGRPAIRAHYAAIFRDFGLELSFDSEETVVADGWAFDRGRTTGRSVPRAGGEPVRIDDRYLMILRRGSEGWRIARLIWNRAAPTPGG